MDLAVGEMGEAPPGIEKGGDAFADFLAVFPQGCVADTVAGVGHVDHVGEILARARLVGLGNTKGACAPASR